jgi:hypothetical protein
MCCGGIENYFFPTKINFLLDRVNGCAICSCMGIRVTCSTVMIPTLNKLDKIDPLIKSGLDALISGTYTTKLSGTELNNLMFMRPTELEKIVECISN